MEEKPYPTPSSSRQNDKNPNNRLRSWWGTTASTTYRNNRAQRKKKITERRRNERITELRSNEVEALIASLKTGLSDIPLDDVRERIGSMRNTCIPAQPCQIFSLILFISVLAEPNIIQLLKSGVLQQLSTLLRTTTELSDVYIQLIAIILEAARVNNVCNRFSQPLPSGSHAFSNSSTSPSCPIIAKKKRRKEKKKKKNPIQRRH